MLTKSGGTRGEIRSSALWGTGSRGGESRSNALWGKGGRRAAMLCAAVFVLGVPLVATASTSKLQRDVYGASGHSRNAATYVAPALTKLAHRSPAKLVHVIVQSNSGTRAAQAAVAKIQQLQGTSRGSGVKRLNLVDGVAVAIEARKLDALRNIRGLTVTPDAPVALDGSVTYSTQLWPYEAGLAPMWPQPFVSQPQAPTIAVVDSGIDANRADFSNGSRVLANVNLSSLSNNSPGDGRGHGTFVSSIAAGSAAGYAGAAPNANLVSLDVMDDNGMALTSDVISAAQWIVANKSTYNIRVANFSLHSTNPSNFTRDPLDRAAEKLWFAGVTVVAAAGNYRDPTSTGPSRVKYAPGNDPFVITVGAADLNNTLLSTDDTAAPWSAYGYTYDGFSKPDIGAPGRYMVGAIPMTSTLAAQRADKIVAPGYIQLSGTSFAAPAVAGAAAQILARHPGFTPDQVKGALMAGSNRMLPAATPGSLGVGELSATRAALIASPPNPNAALDKFVGPDPTGDSVPAFDSVSWLAAAKADVSWDTISISDNVWSGSSVSMWDAVSLLDVSLGDISISDVGLLDASLSDISLEDVAEGDANNTGGYALTPSEVDALNSDPNLAVATDALPPTVTSADATAGTTPLP